MRFYGGENGTRSSRQSQNGRNFLDLFVAQEARRPELESAESRRAAGALYPAEGTLWTDHPLALLRTGPGRMKP